MKIELVTEQPEIMRVLLCYLYLIQKLKLITNMFTIRDHEKVYHFSKGREYSTEVIHRLNLILSLSEGTLLYTVSHLPSQNISYCSKAQGIPLAESKSLLSMS